MCLINLKKLIIGLFLFIVLIFSINGIDKMKDRYTKNIFPEIQIQKDIEFGVVTNYKSEKEKLLLDVYLQKK